MKKIKVVLAIVTFLALGTFLWRPLPTYAQDPIDVPDALMPPTDEEFFLEIYATGDQIYSCEPRPNNPSRYEWSQQAPDAEMVDAEGNFVGTYFEGPTWKAFDESWVIGDPVVRWQATDTALPWVLWRVKEKSTEGVLAQVTSVQRINTAGGVGTTPACNPAEATEAKIPFTATFRLFRAAQAQETPTPVPEATATLETSTPALETTATPEVTVPQTMPTTGVEGLVPITFVVVGQLMFALGEIFNQRRR